MTASSVSGSTQYDLYIIHTDKMSEEHFTFQN